MYIPRLFSHANPFSNATGPGVSSKTLSRTSFRLWRSWICAPSYTLRCLVAMAEMMTGNTRTQKKGHSQTDGLLLERRDVHSALAPLWNVQLCRYRGVYRQTISTSISNGFSILQTRIRARHECPIGKDHPPPPTPHPQKKPTTQNNLLQKSNLNWPHSNQIHNSSHEHTHTLEQP